LALHGRLNLATGYESRKQACDESRASRDGISETDWGCFLEGDHRGLVVGVVEHIGYDGKTGAVTVKLGSNGQQS
jgi:hypothetical protein